MLWAMAETAVVLGSWKLDPHDPRAPSQAEWDAMNEQERAEVVVALPSDFEPNEAMPPEGDFHDDEASRLKRGLRRFFGDAGRRVYVAGNLPVYYPVEPMFAPDLFAVVDVDPHFRSSWVVSAEGKGLNLALEIVWAGSRRKDLVENLERYARLGIPEYFVFDLPRERLLGYRLSETRYLPLTMRAGRFPCRELGLEVGLEGKKVRFYDSTAEIPDLDEVIARLESTVDRAVDRTLELEQQLEEARRERQQESQAREEVQTRLDEALAKLRELEKSRKS
jgi:Uma2 family endonuclease